MGKKVTNWFFLVVLHFTTLSVYGLCFDTCQKKTEYYSNGKIYSIACYNDSGKPEGIKTRYYENGIIMEKSFFFNGVQDSTYQYFEKDGTLLMESSYKVGKKEGIEIWYFSNGRIQKKIGYQNGVQAGTATYFYSNGNIESTGEYFNDARNGKWYFYYKNGSLKIIGSYIPQKKEYVLMEQIDKNSSAMVQHIEYIKDGTWTYFNRRGVPYKMEIYSNGNLTR